MYAVPFAYFAVLFFGLIAGLLLDVSMMTMNRAQVQAGLDAAAIAGATQQKQIVLTTNSYGAPLTWTYELESPNAQIVAQQTWAKNVNQWPNGVYGAGINGPNWSFPDPYSIKGDLDLNMQPALQKKMFEGLFNTVPNTIPDITAPVSAKAGIPARTYP